MPLRLETRPIRRSDPSFPSPSRSTSTILATPSRLKLLYGPPANGMAPVTVHGHVSATFRSRAKDWIAAGKQLYSSAASTSRAETPASASARSPDSAVPVRVQQPLLRQGHDVLRLGRREREDPAVALESELCRPCRRADENGNGLVDVPLAAVPLGVRERQHGVSRRGIANRLWAHGLRPPG